MQSRYISRMIGFVKSLTLTERALGLSFAASGAPLKTA